ncbi:MAG: alpha amylase C-terminal domain-containing protein, partial [Victivallales bacterium]|nr:alpha amylase C-terminal domain-containing protein [Victivallales bacterium]
VFDSDNVFYGGFGRIGSDWTVKTETDDDFDEKRYSLKLYLPCRTAIVLRLKYNP